MPLKACEQPERGMYGTPGFKKWLEIDLPKLEPGRLSAADSPQEQVDWRLYQWISGKRIVYSKQFKDLMPMKDEVWEMKTVDVRIFGWIYKPLIFICVFADYADLYKGANRSRNYEDAKQKVLAARNSLPLDEPKVATGAFDELVCV